MQSPKCGNLNEPLSKAGARLVLERLHAGAAATIDAPLRSDRVPALLNGKGGIAPPRRRHNPRLNSRPPSDDQADREMLNATSSRLSRLTGVVAAIALLGAGALILLAPGSARPDPPGVQALPSSSNIAEGPGGRTPLTHWTLRRDPANRGLSKGWQRGGFAGTAVSVPNVVNPTPFTGAAGARNYEGSVAWYRTTISASEAGIYALTFQSANYRASVWVDGHAAGHARGLLPALRSAREARSRARTRSSCASTGATPARSRAQAFTARGSTGAASTARSKSAAIGESELSEPTIQTTLSPDTPSAAQATVTVQRAGAQQRTGPRVAPEGTLVHGSQTIALHFPAQMLASRPVGARDARRSPSREPALWSPTAPEPLPADARDRPGEQLLRARRAARS